jgi:pimeloyl-ACP methyl ester carboxylesterase
MAFLLIMGGLGGTAHAEGKFEQSKCWFDLPRDRDLLCGHLTIPENRSKSNGRLIKLPAVIFEPDRVRHEPIVYLTGGPGQMAMIDNERDIDQWWSFIDNSPWVRGRRLVVVEQRGVGRAEPSLDCSAHYTPSVWSEIIPKVDDVVDFDLEKKREVAACRDALIKKGIDLSAYNTIENAADIHDLRAALGIEKWVIYGISYGTKLALQVLEDHPEDLIAVVLDSALPLDVAYIDEDANSLDSALRTLDKDCSRHAGCSENFPDLLTMVGRIVRQLNVQPLLLRLEGDEDSARFMRVSGDDFLELMFDQFYNRDAIEVLPQLIKDTSRQDYRLLVEMHGGNPNGEDRSDFADGMHLSIVCNDGVSASAPSPNFPLFDNWAADDIYTWACELWPSSKPATTRKSLEANRVPVLILSGEYDPATPSKWAKYVAGKTGSSQLVVFRGIGHGVVDTTPCGGDVVSDFLDKPKAPVTTSCLNEMESPHFLGSEEVLPSKLEASAVPPMPRKHLVSGP